MGMACVRDQSTKAHIQVHGTMALKCLVFTSGQGNFRLLVNFEFLGSFNVTSLINAITRRYTHKHKRKQIHCILYGFVFVVDNQQTYKI